MEEGRENLGIMSKKEGLQLAAGRKRIWGAWGGGKERSGAIRSCGRTRRLEHDLPRALGETGFGSRVAGAKQKEEVLGDCWSCGQVRMRRKERLGVEGITVGSVGAGGSRRAAGCGLGKVWVRQLLGTYPCTSLVAIPISSTSRGT